MNPWRWVDPRVGAVRLAGVRAYLLDHGWSLRPNPNPNLLRFERPAAGKGKPVFYVVPASDQVSDFAQSIIYLITTLSELEDRHPVAVLNDILRQPVTPANGPAAATSAQTSTR